MLDAPGTATASCCNGRCCNIQPMTVVNCLYFGLSRSALDAWLLLFAGLILQFSRTFWELRGFEEETVLEMISVCNRVDEFTDCTMLLRAGRGYAEYQPGNGERLSM